MVVSRSCVMFSCTIKFYLRCQLYHLKMLRRFMIPVLLQFAQHLELNKNWNPELVRTFCVFREIFTNY